MSQSEMQTGSSRPSRREVLGLAAAAFLPLHPLRLASGTKQTQPGGSRDTTPRLLALRLQTHVLDEVRRFYRDILQFPLLSDSSDRLVVGAGASQLEFERAPAGSRPFYHFAFNIPENKIESAREWLRSRVSIQRHAVSGSDIIHFEQWHAHSVFFDDPAGNLVEFIARHTLQNAAPGPFSVADVLYASEIGIVPSDQPGVFAQIRDGLNWPVYLNSRSFLGDERGLLIVIPREVKWIPRLTKNGIACPTHITVAGQGTRRLRFDEGPFEIFSTAQ